MADETKNDKAWEILFQQRPIVQDVDATGIHRITATDINQIGKREARLMTKFDHTVNLPRLFEEKGLAIIPDSRSSYIIGRFDCYAKMDESTDDEIVEQGFPSWMQSISPENLYSEASALLCAQHAGLIADVMGEDVALTVFGRMSTGEFDFSINAKSSAGTLPKAVHVDRAQCEIDGGFEGPETLGILEVKNQEVSDFHIRQLFYPYRLWAGKVTKQVVPVFLTYSNEIFTFSVYKFQAPEDYNSLQLVKRKRYQIAPTEIEISDIRAALARTSVIPEPAKIPFPQADTFERVIDMLASLRASNGQITRDDTTTKYAFNIRQTNYYTDAGRYLGLIDKGRDKDNGVYYFLTPLGLQIMNKAPRLRNLALIELILSRGVFRAAMDFYLTNARPPSKADIEAMMASAQLPYTGTTPGRRASSVSGWLRWIIGLTANG